MNDFVSYEDGQKAREELKQNALKMYKQKHTNSEMICFIEANLPSFHEVHPQDTNYAEVYSMFSIKTQRIYANSIRELLDKALDDVLINGNQASRFKPEDDEFLNDMTRWIPPVE